MLEINKKQLLSFDDSNKAIILKHIALGLIKYTGDKENRKIIERRDMEWTYKNNLTI